MCASLPAFRSSVNPAPLTLPPAPANCQLQGLGLPAEAAKKKPSYYEKRDAYEKELKASLQVRGGEMPSVKASPPGLYVGERKMKPLDFSDLKKTTREPTKGLPTALPTRD